MQAVILAAGRGTRLKELTCDTPKPMLKVNGRPILEHTIELLPKEVREVILVIGYRGEAIRDYFGREFSGIKLKYAEVANGGTAAGLYGTKSLLNDGSFLVVFGDDMRSGADLKKFSKEKVAFGLYKGIPSHSRYWNILVNDSGYVYGASAPSEKELSCGINAATGVFMLDKRIFDYEPVPIAGGEFGLPQTILKMAKDVRVKAVFMDKWLPITYPEDLIKAEKFLL